MASLGDEWRLLDSKTIACLVFSIHTAAHPADQYWGPTQKPYFHPGHPCFLILFGQCFCGILLDLRGDNLGNHGDMPVE